MLAANTTTDLSVWVLLVWVKAGPLPSLARGEVPGFTPPPLGYLLPPLGYSVHPTSLGSPHLAWSRGEVDGS